MLLSVSTRLSAGIHVSTLLYCYCVGVILGKTLQTAVYCGLLSVQVTNKLHNVYSELDYCPSVPRPPPVISNRNEGINQD